jgi:hypothetical protein
MHVIDYDDPSRNESNDNLIMRYSIMQIKVKWWKFTAISHIFSAHSFIKWNGMEKRVIQFPHILS